MALKKPQKEIVVVLPDIRSALNVGSILRTADAAGITKVFLAGYTPAPMDKFGRVNKQISKTALGVEQAMPWEKAEDIQKLLRRLARAGFDLVAVEQATKAIDYKKFKPRTKTAFIFGNEAEGLPPKILRRCCQVIEIPMRGKKESLNVAVAAGIILFRTLNI
jgi:23S rRNA (guanosine2251-2'-O)-methyltransferase